MIYIAIFASGTGSNAQKIMEYFKSNTLINIQLVVSNKENAGVLQHAKNYGIESMLLQNKEQFASSEFLSFLKRKPIHFIVLAGFLWLIPEELIHQFPDRIVNIHPSLLPKYGGKGMYGNKVHEAVVANNEKESGISIHLVNNEYDKGQLLFQKSVLLDASDTAEIVAKKVLALEHQFFPKIIEDYCLKNYQTWA
jgi:phosphoribosylglycinamide formyltransferase-1